MAAELAARLDGEISVTTTTSPCAPPVGVEGLQPTDSTCRLRDAGEMTSPVADPRCHPLAMVNASRCTSETPFARNWLIAHCAACSYCSVPVRRTPRWSSRYWSVAMESLVNTELMICFT